VLETMRLRLAELEETDAAFVLELLNEPGFLTNIGDRDVRTLDDAAEYIRNVFAASYPVNGFGLYRVDLKETGEPIGLCGLVRRDWLEDVDIGFAFLERHWGRRYARESAAAVMAWAAEALGIDRVVGITAPENHASMRVLESLGLRFEGMVTAPGKTEPTRLFVPD
jgi:[ribosomal protein S5]-alanine N-acetyltransferase